MRNNPPFAPIPGSSIPDQKNILVVDDSKQAADAFAELLRALGWRAKSVYSGEEARTYLMHRHADIVLLDIEMPKMDGYQLAALLRNDLHLSIPIIALTGYSDEEVVAKALSAGCTALLVKPVGLKDLKKTIAAFLK